MKKTLLGIGILAMMASCGGSAEDVNIADVKDACGCSSGLVEIANDVLNEIGNRSENDMKDDEELKRTLEPKLEKLKELDDKCRIELKVTKEEMMACDDGLEEVMEKFERKF